MIRWVNLPSLGRRPAWWWAWGGALLPAAAARASEAEAARHSYFWPMAFQIVNFVLLIILLTVLLKRPLGTFLLNRRERISSSIDEATELRRGAEEELKGYEARLRNLSREIAEMSERLAAEGEAEKQRFIDAAETQAERLAQSMENLARQELARARLELQREISAQMLSAAAGLLRENLEEKDHQKLIEDYITKVG